MALHPALVLGYHGVADVRAAADPNSLFTAPRALRNHIALLRRWGYRFVTFGELAGRAVAGTAAGCVALTFDDGFADNRTNLLPLLREEGVPATVFVATGLIGSTHPDAVGAPMLTADDIVALAQGGVEIGAHSHAHRDLTTMTFDQVVHDMSMAREVLEGILGRQVRVAAYPFGAATVETRRACRAAGYEAACRTRGEGDWEDPWNLPRQDMNGYSGVLGLRLKRQGRYEPLMQSFVGRAVRSAGRRTKALIG